MFLRNDASTSLPYKASIVWFPPVSMYSHAQQFIIAQLCPFNNVYSLGKICYASLLIDFVMGKKIFRGISPWNRDSWPWIVCGEHPVCKTVSVHLKCQFFSHFFPFCSSITIRHLVDSLFVLLQHDATFPVLFVVRICDDVITRGNSCWQDTFFINSVSDDQLPIILTLLSCLFHNLWPSGNFLSLWKSGMAGWSVMFYISAFSLHFFI